MVKGIECKLTDCPHNKDRACAIDSRAEPLLEWVSFTGYCPDYEGIKFPGVKDESRKGKSIFANKKKQ